ncbi:MULTISPECIES: TetR/AcrR family transcriptional regulator [unclassified Sporolactobacillus]|uniref:TetR/AcrR family transcriptional regulator n=1 Tax=unclassified Sporolactobacillus TaxID=2628533 RepID=UPI00236819FE|nr:TetR/AcrR family transcriptional regulator [Sporolactobacillus sp. CQH2019]MDD9147771.1 TetR/AcrR family transcriptional regulator [Sporolactobacillus sp. CQH2019]
MSEPANERARKKKDQILRSAKELFIQQGFDGTSMDDICEHAGVSKQTIYSYYSGKDKLLFGVIRHQLFLLSDDGFTVVLDQLDFSTPDRIEASLSYFAGQLIDYFMKADYLQLARIVVAEVVRYPQLARLFREAVPLRGLSNVERMLEMAKQSDYVEIDNVEIAARGFVGMLLTYMFIDGVLAGDDRADKPTQEQIHEIVRFYLPSILTGSRA